MKKYMKYVGYIYLLGIVISMIYYYFYPTCRGSSAVIWGSTIADSLLWIFPVIILPLLHSLPESVRHAIGGLIAFVVIIFVIMMKKKF